MEQKPTHIHLYTSICAVITQSLAFICALNGQPVKDRLDYFNTLLLTSVHHPMTLLLLLDFDVAKNFLFYPILNSSANETAGGYGQFSSVV